METGSLVAKPVLASTEFSEVPGGTGHYIIVELELDTTSRTAADVDVKLIE